MPRLLRLLKRALPHRSPVRLAWHHAKAFCAALLYGFPARRLTVIAVTGTDGKTTTVGMIAHILAHAGIRVGALSTAFLKTPARTAWNQTQKTSPSPFLIQKFLRQLVSEGATHAVLEVSSHGLVQGRLTFTRPLVAAVTNVTPEHLDYHGTLEQYREDKGLLLRMVRPGGTKVLNAADPTFPLYAAIPSQQTIAWAVTEGGVRGVQRIQGVQGNEPDASLWIEDIRMTEHGSSATFHRAIRNQKSEIRNLSLPIPGVFNIENALCAIACCRALGIPVETAAGALASFPGIAGRLERIDEGQPFAVFVDFTVTPAAYEKTLTTLRAMLPAGQRLLVLTGSCGDRMREKRPIIGRLCSAFADVMVVTSDETYGEPHEQIIADVWSGIDQSKTQAHRILDRREAIAFLLREARPGDCVAICGMAGATTMMTAEGQIPWDEREITRELLRSLR